MPNDLQRAFEHIEPEEDDTPRKGGWIQTYSGVKFYPFDPRPEDIHILDIAHALSHINRWTGHSIKPYSVAQHSLMVARLLPDNIALEGLLHDATEAYLTDVATPIKSDPLMAGYREAEEHMRICIAEKFGLMYITPAEVHKADKIALATELRDLMQFKHPDWEMDRVLEEPRSEKITVMSAPHAKQAFLNHFDYYCKLYKNGTTR